jgi:hypothetical protein
MVETEPVCLGPSISSSAHRRHTGSPHSLCYCGILSMLHSLLFSRYYWKAIWSPGVCFSVGFGKMLVLFYLSLNVPHWRCNVLKLMQIILVSLQLRMFTLLPSIQNPLNLIQIQKVCPGVVLSQLVETNSMSTYSCSLPEPSFTSLLCGVLRSLSTYSTSNLLGGFSASVF